MCIPMPRGAAEPGERELEPLPAERDAVVAAGAPPRQPDHHSPHPVSITGAGYPPAAAPSPAGLAIVPAPETREESAGWPAA